MKITKYIAICITTVLFSGCVKELNDPAISNDICKDIRFSTRVNCGSEVVATRSSGLLTEESSDWKLENISTKGTPVSILSGAACVYGYQYSESFTAEGKFMDNKRYQFDGEDLIPDEPYAWVKLAADKDKAFFASYAPYGATGITPCTYNNFPGVSYTVPSDASDQKDVLYACTEVNRSDFKKVVPLEFKHALTAIQFRIGFDCKVKSISLKGIKNKAVFTFANKWEAGTYEPSDEAQLATYSFSFGDGQSFAQNQILNAEENTLMLIPQDFPAGSSSSVELTYVEEGVDKTISASLAGLSWGIGKKIVYTLYKENEPINYVYFDLALGKVTINDQGYSGKINVNNVETEISHTLQSSESISQFHFYVFQSNFNSKYTDNNDPNYWKKTGYASAEDIGKPDKIRLPNYSNLTVGGTTWGEYINNNKDVVAVINAWNSAADNWKNNKGTGRIPVTESVKNIDLTCSSSIDLTIDNLFNDNPGSAAIYFNANQTKGKLYLKLKGDSRFDHITYIKSTNAEAHGEFIITSADGDRATSGTLTLGSFKNNDIDNNNVCILGPNTGEASYGLQIKGGTIYAGNPPIQNNIWGKRETFKFPALIGGGVNQLGEVTINGGRLTVVANGTSAAIGGGGGYQSAGGPGLVNINGGEVYAYATGIYSTDGDYTGFVPTTAIGGSSTFQSNANDGTIVNITGGYVYAESLGGTAIGGGNSQAGKGGNATVNISGDAIVVARSIPGKANGGAYDVKSSTAVGGGSSIKKNGGDATMVISGGRLTTGSVGGGGAFTAGMKMGSANITISGSAVISGQFVMAKGASTEPSFTMSGGAILKGDTNDPAYANAKNNGGAVYMEAGTCTISGGVIRNCSAEKGGAVYMNGGVFNMSGGTISKNTAKSNGGAVCIEGGNVTMSGGEISGNITINGNGGGVFVSGGSFLMSNTCTGIIQKNSANSNGDSTTGNGGGVYVGSDSEDIYADILSGKVSENTADRNGGGFYVEVSGEASADIAIGISGKTPASPSITDNSASSSGGGMCVIGTKANVSIYSGTVHGDVSAHVNNPDIRNDGGTVTLIGEYMTNWDVRYNTVRFHSNNGLNDTAEQKIVTSTNSKLSPPSEALQWKKEFHTLSEWNTKKDGTGSSYQLSGGEVMNISNDIDLYAIYVPQTL